MATPSANTDPKKLATIYLKTLKVPVTTTNINALALWFKYESPHTGSDIVVRGNNPLNIQGTGPCGSWTSANGLHTFKIFCTPEQGAQAWATNLTSGWGKKYGYDRIVLALQHGNNETEVLKAIADSGWVSGKPLGVKGHIPQYKFPGIENAVSIVVPPDIGNESAAPGLGAWGNIISFPEGHKVTSADVDLMLKKLDEAGYFKSNAPGAGDIGRTITKAVLMTAVGKEWDKSLQNDLQTRLNAAAVESGKDLNPLNQAQVEIQFLQNIADPKNWVKIGAIIAGGIITLFGAWLLFKNASNDGGTAESLVSPMPIILREKV